jgi:hypothetical protein
LKGFLYFPWLASAVYLALRSAQFCAARFGESVAFYTFEILPSQLRDAAL